MYKGERTNICSARCAYARFDCYSYTTIITIGTTSYVFLRDFCSLANKDATGTSVPAPRRALVSRRFNWKVVSVRPVLLVRNFNQLRQAFAHSRHVEGIHSQGRVVDVRGAIDRSLTSINAHDTASICAIVFLLLKDSCMWCGACLK